MIGTCFPLSRPSAPAVSTTQTSGALNGRTLNAAPPASPRISCNSSWWAALTQGGFKGLHHWIIRTRQDRGLSIEQRKSIPDNVKLAIGNALTQAVSRPAVLGNNFQKVLKEAAWYAVDINEVVRSTFLSMKKEQLEKIKEACAGKESLNWLVRKIDERLTAVANLAPALADGFFKSAGLFSEGYLLGGVVQQELWKKMDQLFDSVGGCNLAEKVAIAISNGSPWALLPFAERQYKGIASTSRVLEEICRQAETKLKNLKSVDFSKVNDIELAKFRELVANGQFKHHAPACKAERVKRAHTAKFNQLESQLEGRLSLLATSSYSTQKTKQPPSVGPASRGLHASDISGVTSRVIAKLDPEIVLKLSKLDSNAPEDMLLKEAATNQLSTPGVALLDDVKLIAYLKLPKDEISPTARKQLVAEAKNRVAKLFADRFAILEGGLKSSSCHNLVRAVLEFFQLAERCAELERAAGLEDSSEDLPNDFSKKLSKIKERQILFARHLVHELQERGHKHVADRLSWAIHGSRNEEFFPLAERARQFMEETVAQYIPTTEAASSRLDAQSDVALGAKFLNLFETYILDDDSFRKVRTDEGEEIPVCAQFVKDQRSSKLQVNGSPVFNSHIPTDLGRAREFVRRMRDVKGMNEEQIMTASRIACQSVPAVLILVARNEKLLSLTHAEAMAAGVSRTDFGLGPSQLDHSENFVLNKDGSLTVHVRIFNESVDKWFPLGSDSAEIPPVITDPEQSSFSAELKFELDTNGIIQEVMLGNLAFERKILDPDS